MSRRALPIQDRLVIPAAEIFESASRSSGPGGQHVNKTNTRITLRWNVLESSVLSAEQRTRIRSRLKNRLTQIGSLVVHAGRHRSQARNRELARERLAELVRDALATPRAAGARRDCQRQQRHRREQPDAQPGGRSIRPANGFLPARSHRILTSMYTTRRRGSTNPGT